MNPFAIVPAMKRASFLLALTLVSALPLMAQSNQLGIVVGGSRRFIDTSASDDPFAAGNFSFSNSVIDLFWSTQIDEDVALKFKAGRIETTVTEQVGASGVREGDGEVQHLDMVAEYQFDEPFGKTGIFAGIGLYRKSGEDVESSNNFGWSAGITADFPLARRYGVVVDGTYHWTRADYRPRYLTVGAGLRVSF